MPEPIASIAPPVAPPVAPARARWPLIAHPNTPCHAVDAIHAEITREGQGWRLRYRLAGDLAQLRIPPPAARPAAPDGLWQHTCFEVFVGAAGTPAYREFNLCPSAHWAAYAFRAERERDVAAPALPAPRIVCTQDANRLTLDAWLPDGALPCDAVAARLGFTAVIESAHGSLSYWALHHPAPRPDFHHPDGWTARLPLHDS